MEGLWRNFDKIFCINLKTRDDKFKHASRIFEELGIPAEIHRVGKHPKGGIQGCFESHIELVKRAYDSGCKNVLIFEDDLKPNKISRERLLEVVGFIKGNADWDIFYLGLCPYFFIIPRKIRGSVYKLRNACSHAYVLNRPFMRKIKDLNFSGHPIDCLYGNDGTTRSYGLYPSLFYQSDFGTDIQFNDNPFSNWRENFIQKHKPELLEFYEDLVFYRFEGLALVAAVLFVVALVYVICRRRSP